MLGFVLVFFLCREMFEAANNWRVAIPLGSLTCSWRLPASPSSLKNLSAVQSHKTHGWTDKWMFSYSRYCNPRPPPEPWRCSDYQLLVVRRALICCSRYVLNIYWLVNLFYEENSSNINQGCQNWYVNERWWMINFWNGNFFNAINAHVIRQLTVKLMGSRSGRGGGV